MRKTGLGGVVMGKRNQKRKEEAAAQAAASSPKAASPQQKQQQQQQQQQAPPNNKHQQETRRKPTPDEAAMTAKNYRLAKELSELRVRHREECKNVTKLTMENMNLASRCREAISHVAMLKKELAAQQRRTQAATLLSVSPLSSSASAASVAVQQPAPAVPVQQRVTTPKSPTTSSRANANVPVGTTAQAVAPVAVVVATATSAVEAPSPTTQTPPAPAPLPTAVKSASRPAPIVPTSVVIPVATEKIKAGDHTAPPPPPPPSPVVSTQVQAEMDRMDRILAEHASSSTTVLLSAAAAADNSSSSSTAAANKVSATTTVVADIVKVQAPARVEIEKVQVEKPTTPTTTSSQEDEDEPCSVEPKPLEVSSLSVEPVRTKPEPVKSRVVADLAIRTNSGEPMSSASSLETTESLSSTAATASSTASTAAASAAPLYTKRKDIYQEEYPGDISVVRKANRLDKKLERMGDFKETDDEGSVNSSNSNPNQPVVGSTKSTGKNFERVKNGPDKSTMSSIDAFEASFRTDFPDSFSPREDSVEEKKTAESGIYNPFFPSPKKSPGQESAPVVTGDRPWANNASKDRPSVAARRMESRRHSGPKSPTAGGTPTASPSAGGGKNGLTLDALGAAKAPFTNASPSPGTKRAVVAVPIGVTGSPVATSPAAATQRYSPVTPQQGPSPRGTTSKYRTPPPIGSTPSPESEPQRPEKTGYDAARARYEKALKPRGGTLAVAVPDNERDNRDESPKPSVVSAVTAGPVVVSDAEVNSLEAPARNGYRSTSVRDRAAAFSDSSPPPPEVDARHRGTWSAAKVAADKKPAFYPSSDSDDGDIPMNSSLSPQKPGFGASNGGGATSSVASPNPVSYRVNGTSTASAKTAIQDARTRLRPWDSSSSGSSQLNEEREFDQSEMDAAGPASRFTITGKSRRSVNDPPHEYQSASNAGYRRGDVYRPKQDAPAGI